MKYNKIIQSFWYGEELSVMEQLCINSFLQNGHDFHLYCYDSIKNIPDGCTLKDAELIVPKEKFFLDSHEGIAGFSDYFRMNLLYYLGGWWVDMDIICLKYFDIIDDYCFTSEYANNVIHPNNGCIKCPPNSEFMLEYIFRMDKILAKNKQIQWGTFGPRMMKDLLQFYESSDFIHPPEKFIMPNAICKDKKLYFLNIFTDNPNFEHIKNDKEAYSIHLYNELCRMHKIDKNAIYPENSIYEYLKRIYLGSVSKPAG